MQNNQTQKTRWRLILEAGTGSTLGNTLDAIGEARSQAITYLYDREYGQGRNVRPQSRGGDKEGKEGKNLPQNRQGGLEASQLTIPDWINAIHELFPKKTIERLEKDALERYQLEEMVTNPDLLSRAQPSQTLLKAVLRTKHLMNQEVLAMAKQLVRKVIEQLLDKLAKEIQSPFTGAVDRRRRSFLKVAKNFEEGVQISDRL